MSETKHERIEQINRKIVALMLERKQMQRRGTWTQEQAVTEQIDKLEAEIKRIEEE